MLIKIIDNNKFQNRLKYYLFFINIFFLMPFFNNKQIIVYNFLYIFNIKIFYIIIFGIIFLESID